MNTCVYPFDNIIILKNVYGVRIQGHLARNSLPGMEGGGRIETGLIRKILAVDWNRSNVDSNLSSYFNAKLAMLTKI